MKSRITIEVDFDNSNSPVIQILQHPDSDDVRDKLIKNFTQQFLGSTWCKIEWKAGDNDFNKIHISPIHAAKLKDEAELMIEQHRVYEKWALSHPQPVING